MSDYLKLAKKAREDVSATPPEPGHTSAYDINDQNDERVVVDIRTVAQRSTPEACELEAAGWKSKERCGKTIWERPDNGFYVSEEMALLMLRNASG